MISINEFIALCLGLFIGSMCRWFDVPLPAPSKLVGALLILVMTLGFITGNTLISF